MCPGAFSSSTAHEVDSRKHVERSRKGKHLGASSDDEGSYQALSVVFQDSSNLREIIFAAIPIETSNYFECQLLKNIVVVFNVILSPFSIISDSAAPPRPPLPADGGFQQAPPPARPPPPPALDTTDDESEDLFQNAPTASQGPIMVWIKAINLLLLIDLELGTE